MISVGKSDNEAEKLVVSYAFEKLQIQDINEGKMWVALAITEWELGRLSPETKEKAFMWIPKIRCVIDESTIETAIRILESPIPPKKLVRKPRTKHCPWREGSILAYRIQSNDRVAQSPYWQKYVLLRIIKVKRWPITQLAPDECYNESMLVALYDWVGAEIPSAIIVPSLKFTPVSIERPTLNREIFQKCFQHTATELPESGINEIINRLTSMRLELSFSLIWDKKVQRDGTLTLLQDDPDFVLNETCFDTGITAYSTGGVLAFDAILCKRLEELANPIVPTTPGAIS